MSVVSEPRLPSTPRIPDQAQAQDGAELQGGRPFGVKPEVLYGLKESSRLRAVKDWIKQHSLPYRTAIFLKSIPHGIKGLIKGKRGAWDHLKATMSFVTRADRIAGRPINITIEPTNLCNLECPVCETGAGILARKQGHMTLDQFKVIVDRIAEHTNTLQFYFMGEPFINKQAYEMIRYAKDCGIPFITTCTNGDIVNPEKLIECGIDEVNFQIGGMSQPTHETYRINSNLDRVLRNMRETLRLRNERHARMWVVGGYILMKHNEHEVPLFEQTMREMGANHWWVIDPCVRTIDQGKQMLPTDKAHWFYDPGAFERGILRPRILMDNECPWIYHNMAVQVNGDVVPCCRDNQGTEIMGNLLAQSLDEIWNGEKYVQLRKRIHEDQGKVKICRLCSSYGASPLN